MNALAENARMKDRPLAKLFLRTSNARHQKIADVRNRATIKTAGEISVQSQVADTIVSVSVVHRQETLTTSKTCAKVVLIIVRTEVAVKTHANVVLMAFLLVGVQDAETNFNHQSWKETNALPTTKVVAKEPVMAGTAQLINVP